MNRDLILTAMDLGVVEASGAWYQCRESGIFTKDKVQGQAGVFKDLQGRPEAMKALKKLVYEEIDVRKTLSYEMSEVDEEKVTKKDKEGD